MIRLSFLKRGEKNICAYCNSQSFVVFLKVLMDVQYISNQSFAVLYFYDAATSKVQCNAISYLTTYISTKYLYHIFLPSQTIKFLWKVWANFCLFSLCTKCGSSKWCRRRNERKSLHIICCVRKKRLFWNRKQEKTPKWWWWMYYTFFYHQLL